MFNGNYFVLLKLLKPFDVSDFDFVSKKNLLTNKEKKGKKISQSLWFILQFLYFKSMRKSSFEVKLT